MTTKNTEDKINFLYKITNKINGKVYIGQTVQPNKRWYQHRVDSAKPRYPIHYAIKKYGAHNFLFEIIASCKGFDNANELETILVDQYDSYVSNNKGYNATHGGMNAPKSERWFKAMDEWRASLSAEEWAEINQKRSDATYRQIQEKGHPATGRVVSQETRDLLRKKRLENPIEYTPELRKKMSDAHIGYKQPKEQVEKRSKSLKEQWKIRGDYASKKCAAPGCDVSGKAKYRIIDGVRYCRKHGLRMKRNGQLDKLPPFKWTKDNPMPEEIRQKCGKANIGRVAHNRIVFSDDQIKIILDANRSIKSLAREFKVTEKVIKRVKEGKY